MRNYIFGVSPGNFILLRNDITGSEHRVMVELGEPLKRDQIRRCRAKLLDINGYMPHNWEEIIGRAKNESGSLGEHGSQSHEGYAVHVTEGPDGVIRIEHIVIGDQRLRVDGRDDDDIFNDEGRYNDTHGLDR